MAFTDQMIYQQYDLLLATLRFEDSVCILNRVRDLQPDEMPINSIGILQVGGSQFTAWVVAIPKQLSIAYGEVLCLVMTCGHSFIQPFRKTDSTPSLRFTFEQEEAEIAKALLGIEDKYLKLTLSIVLPVLTLKTQKLTRFLGFHLIYYMT